MANMVQALMFPATFDISASNAVLDTWYEASASTYRSVNNFNVTVTDGDLITQWVDRSAGAHNASADGGGNKATWRTNQRNGLGAIVLASGKKMNINPFNSFTSINQYTIFIVCKFDSTATRQRLIETNHTGDGEAGFGISSSGTYEYFMGGGAATGAAANTNWNVHMYKYDGTQTDPTSRYIVRINGTLQSLTFSVNPETSTGSGNLFQIGTRPDGTLPFAGSVGEICIFTRALTVADTNAVNNYLRGKWVL